MRLFVVLAAIVAVSLVEVQLVSSADGRASISDIADNTVDGMLKLINDYGSGPSKDLLIALYREFFSANHYSPAAMGW